MMRVAAVALSLSLAGCAAPPALGIALGSAAAGWLTAAELGITVADNLADAAKLVAGVVCEKERPKPHSAELAARIKQFCSREAKGDDAIAILDAASHIMNAVKAETP